jgi:prepilin-type N-terminal cleavage/methylation domain-containing protein
VLKLFIQKYNKISGFTLAEVLITLLIIGVVASMVIPNIINDSQDAEIKTAWKKAYAEIDQASRQVMMDNGGTFINLCTASVNNCFRSKFENYMNITKDCIPGLSEGNCWGDWGNDLGAFILTTGVFVKTEVGSNDCSNNVWHSSLSKCAMIWVDVNGFKGPNLWGKDMYAIQVLHNGIKPLGSPGDGWTGCIPSTNAPNGYGCSAKNLYQ